MRAVGIKEPKHPLSERVRLDAAGRGRATVPPAAPVAPLAELLAELDDDRGER